MTTNGLRVRVIKMAFYTRRIEVVLSIANVGDKFVTALPYGKSVLRDGSGAIYRILATKDWRLTNQQLFLGLRLAPDAQYTGTIAFESPLLDDAARTWELTLGPVLTDGGDAPFSVVVGGIAAPPQPLRNAPPPAPPGSARRPNGLRVLTRKRNTSIRGENAPVPGGETLRRPPCFSRVCGSSFTCVSPYVC